jgi:mRNA-degrading endonuclease RelE of RelBE toxin-antitoxin system
VTRRSTVLGDIRVLYEVDDETATVYVINIGVIA